MSNGSQESLEGKYAPVIGLQDVKKNVKKTMHDQCPGASRGPTLSPFF